MVGNHMTVMNGFSFGGTENREIGFLQQALTCLKVAGRMVFPVSSLFSILFLAALFMTDRVTAFDFFSGEYRAFNPGVWLTAGHLILPFAFLATNLTNRRYGLSYAFWQVLIVWGAIGIASFADRIYTGGATILSQFTESETATAFVIAFVAAQLVNVVVFDRTRGRTWWGAPLMSVVLASLVFCILFHPAIAFGGGEPWMPKMLSDLTIKMIFAIGLLLPYHMMRKSIPAGPGYGGA